jgi:histone deacetylase 6
MVMMDPQNEDIVMGEATTENSHDTNGFIDPRALQQGSNADINFKEDMANLSDVSEITAVSPDSLVALPRRKYLPTGCCYDDRMKLHANADFSISPSHPEDPRRIASIMRILKDSGLVYTGSEEKLAQILRDSPTKFMYRIIARAATSEEICTVHTAAHYEWVANTAKMPSEELRELSQSLDSGRRSLYLGNLTFEAALISAGGAIETCKNVVAGTVKNALAVIRPPGHHAESDEAMGFCLFNNVPIAARVCQADFPDLCRKILILDWDVHHGNGTQNIFYEDPNVLYISLHVYDNGQFYPGQPEDPSVPDAGHENVGAGPGSGKNVNIPWKSQGMGDGEYLGAFQRIVMPIAQEFNPDLVIVSAGFDAAAGDELGGCFVTPACYAHMTHMLMSLAGGKIAVCLEGGYNLKAISRSALAVAQTLMGEPPPRIEMPPIHKDALKVLNKVREAHAPFWECMRPGKVDVGLEQGLGGVRLNGVIRTYQYNLLREKYKMVDLFIFRDKVANALKHQVLVTKGLCSAKKILLVVHDP